MMERSAPRWMENSHAGFPQAYQEVAVEQKVAFIDNWKNSKIMYAAMGADKAQAFNDATTTAVRRLRNRPSWWPRALRDKQAAGRRTIAGRTSRFHPPKSGQGRQFSRCRMDLLSNGARPPRGTDLSGGHMLSGLSGVFWKATGLRRAVSMVTRGGITPLRLPCR